MSSTTDKLKGLANEAVGNVKQAAGKVTGNDKLVAEGKAQELKGEAQKTVGDVKDGAQTLADTVTSKSDPAPRGAGPRAVPPPFEPSPHGESTMNRDQFRGASRHLKGRAQTTARRPHRRPGPPGSRRRQSGGWRRPVRLRPCPRPGRGPRRGRPQLAREGRRAGRISRRRPALRRGRRAAGCRPTAAAPFATPTPTATTTLLAFVGVAFALGWLARSSR